MPEAENILLQRFITSGDPEAFSEIVRRHAGLVYGACLRVLADKDRAADAVQETFLQLLRNARSITGSVPNWLHRVATRKAIDLVRRDSSRRQREAQYAADQPRDVSKWQDLSRHVDEGLDELDDQTREILIDHFFEGRTTTDIAGKLGVSQPTVSRRIDAGVANLRGALRRRGIIVAAASLLTLLGENAVQAAPAVVIKELGKIALVGGQAAAAAGAGSAVSATGAKAAAGVLAGVKAKVVAAAAVTVVGVGSVVTYNHVTQPPEPSPTVVQSDVQQARPSPYVSSPGTTEQPRVVSESPRTGDADREWEELMGMFSADNTAEAPVQPVAAEPSGSEQAEGEVFVGGYAMGAFAAGSGEEAPQAEPNEPPTGFGGYFYGTRVAVPKSKPPDASEEEPPDRRD